MLIFAHEFPCDIYSYEKEYILALLALCATLVSAQEDWRVVRGECLPTGLPEHSYADNNRLAHSKRLPAMNNKWDAKKTYKQLVILLDFCDQTTKAWYYIYDQSGKKIRTLSTSQGELKGYTSTFYIIKQGTAYYITYDANGKRLHTFGAGTVGEVLGAAGDTFTSRNGV